mmetsp:Transcript_63066/g.173251  ORF Transcript_63066/g.173251 Transcript_63066/m.173251 type:complete len:357 (+) Transcript_63066:27-1097(+)
MAAEAKAYLEEQGLSEAMTAAVKQVISERPANAKKRLGEILIAMSAKDGAAGGALQSAFVFTKPHANTQAVRDMVAAKFKEVGIEIVSEGEIDGPTVDEKKYIDQHYYAIASKATLLPPSELPVPADKFKDKFGEDWSQVLADGRAFNALGACEKLGIDAVQLNELWVASKDKLVKLGGGFYCCLLEPEGKDPIYTFNAFFMSMRSKFTAPDASLHYYVVKFSPSTLSWGDFRGQVLGPTDPGKAPAASLRGMLAADWEKLGLKGAPNTTDNGVHASASPFEGLAERMNWLQVPIAEDVFGKMLLEAGLSEAMIKAWSVDPQVSLPGDKKGSIFDNLEDIDLDECIAKCVDISKCN